MFVSTLLSKVHSPCLTKNRPIISCSVGQKGQHSHPDSLASISYDAQRPPGDRLHRTAPWIGAQSAQPGQQLPDGALIKFSKLYTVEHNVRVYDLGRVRKEFQRTLMDSWDRAVEHEIRRMEHRNGVVRPA
jgi:hypothetical protein